MWRIDEFSNIHATYSYFLFKVQNWDSQQNAETTAISNFEISPNLTIPDDMPETLDSITI